MLGFVLFRLLLRLHIVCARRAIAVTPSRRFAFACAATTPKHAPSVRYVHFFFFIQLINYHYISLVVSSCRREIIGVLRRAMRRCSRSRHWSIARLSHCNYGRVLSDDSDWRAWRRRARLDALRSAIRTRRFTSCDRLRFARTVKALKANNSCTICLFFLSFDHMYSIYISFIHFKSQQKLLCNIK